MPFKSTLNYNYENIDCVIIISNIRQILIS